MITSQRYNNTDEAHLAKYLILEINTRVL